MVGRLRKVELLQRLHPGQVRILEPQFDRAPFALLDLGLKQRFQVVEMGVVLLPGFLEALRTERRWRPVAKSGSAE
jgi:hypothetical protein